MVDIDLIINFVCIHYSKSEERVVRSLAKYEYFLFFLNFITLLLVSLQDIYCIRYIYRFKNWLDVLFFHCNWILLLI